eukprot:GHVH01002232.1.p2 GENE.GHVH01002232.1~~GHVH01002232.1.p2  ORF type:complete len:292 (-),score=37.59 GHVH01002232.1:576-1451(-)
MGLWILKVTSVSRRHTPKSDQLLSIVVIMPRYDLELIREKLDMNKENPFGDEITGIGDSSANYSKPQFQVSAPFRKSVDPNISIHEQKFRYKEPLDIENDVRQMTNSVQANCGQLMFLLNEVRPIHSRGIGLSKTVSEFDKLIQASRQREARYVQQIEEQNCHLGRLAEEVHKLATLIPELRQSSAQAKKDHQSGSELFAKASEKWKRQEIKYQNELQNINLQLRQLEDRNLSLRNEFISSKNGGQAVNETDGLSQEREIETLRKEKAEYMQYSKYLLSIIDKRNPSDNST